MSMVERLGFDMPVASATLGHYRILTDVLRWHCDLSYNEFTTLYVLHTTTQPVLLDELWAYLILSRKTVLTILTDLEDRGLVAKHELADDRRRMTIEASPAGSSIVEDALAFLDVIFERILCQNLPSGEFEQFMNAEAMRSALDALRGHCVRLHTVSHGRRHYSAEHFIYWRAIIERWRGIVRERSGLNFNEFGILALLDKKGPLDTHDVVEALMLPRAEVSVRKGHLVDLALLEESAVEHDARRTRLSITDAGRSLVRELHAALERSMAAIGELCDEETSAVINTWYYRMYTNIKRHEEVLGDYGRLKTVLSI